MLLLPFVENAFKYGVSYEQPSSINIDLNVTARLLQGRITNTDFSENRKSRHSGIGISNTIKRLNLQYSGKYSLDHNAADGSYNVSLKLDLN